MARARTAIVYLLCFAASLAAHATITRVQSKSCSGTGPATGTSSISCAFTSSLSSGDTAVVLVGTTNLSTSISISDSASLMWNQAGTTSSSFGNTAAFWTSNTPATAETVTLSGTADGNGTGWTVLIIEYSGMLVGSSYDGSSFNTSTATSVSTGNVTVGNGAPDVLVTYGMVEYQAGQTISLPSGYTTLMSSVNAGNGTMSGGDDIGVSAGTYNATLTVSPTTPRSFHAGLIALKSVAPPSGLVQYAPGYGYPTLNWVVPNKAGNTLVVAWMAGASGAGTAMTLSDSNSNTWTISSYLLTSGGTNVVLYVAYALNCVGGKDTVTLSGGYAGGVNSHFMMEYTGIAAIPYMTSTTVGATSGTSQILPPTGVETGDTAIAVLVDYKNSQTFSTPSGFTAEAGTVTGNGQTMQLFDQITTAGNYSWTTTLGSSAVTYMAATLVLRRGSPPSMGRYQGRPFIAGASSAFDGNTVSGHMLIAMCLGETAISDTQSNAWKFAPIIGEQDGAPLAHFYWAIASSSSADTVTCTSASGIATWEYAGVNAAAPIGQSSEFVTWNGISSFGSGPVYTPATSVLFAVGVNPSQSNNVYTPTSGFLSGSGWSSGTSYQQWDEIVSSGTYSNAITSSSSAIYPNALLLVLSSTPVTYPVKRQANRGSGSCCSDGSFSTGLPTAVKSGNLILVATASQVGNAPPTPTDNQSNTYHLIQGSAALGYGLFYTFASSAGSLTISANPMACVMASEWDNTAGATLDQSANQASSTGTSTSSGSITTTQANELIFSMGYGESSTTGYRTQFVSQNAGWNGMLLACGASHAATWLGYQTQAAVGTYSNTFTWSNSMTISGGIASFLVPTSSPSSSQPNVMVISQKGDGLGRWTPQRSILGQLWGSFGPDFGSRGGQSRTGLELAMKNGIGRPAARPLQELFVIPVTRNSGNP